MNPDDPKFTAHALGEFDDLTPEERAEIEALLARDPAALSEAQEAQALATRLRAELSGEEAAALHEAQRAAVLGAADEGAVVAQKIIRFPMRKALLSAAAACVVVGGVIALLYPGTWAEKDGARNSPAQIGQTLSYEAASQASDPTLLSADKPLMPATPPQFAAVTSTNGKMPELRMSGTERRESQVALVVAATPSPSEFDAGLGIGRTSIQAPLAPVTTATRPSNAGLYGRYEDRAGIEREPVIKLSSPSAVPLSSVLNIASSATRNATVGLELAQSGPAPQVLDISGETRSKDKLLVRDTALLADDVQLSARGTISETESRRLRRENAADFNPSFRSSTASYAFLPENAFLAARENPLSTFSIDVDTASYALVRRFLNGNQRPPKGAVRIEELLNYFTYDYPQPQGDAPFSATMEVAACPWTPAHRLVRIGLKGREMAKDKRPASNLVFLIDVSGSMKPDNKLPLLKQSLALLIEQLGGEDQVAMVVYAGSSGTVLEPTRDKEKMLAALRQLEAGGSTNGASGLHLAYQLAEKAFIKGGTNRVILATDGDWNVGVTSQSDLLDVIAEKAKSGVFLTVLGLGMGNLNDSMMVKLAGRGNGNYAYLDTVAEARKVLVEQLSGTLVTIAKDVKIQVEFNPAEVGAYRLIGYEKRMLAKEDFNDDKKDAGEIGAGHTVTALYEIVPAGKDTPALAKAVDPLKYQPTPLSEPLPSLLQPSDKPGDVFVSAYMAMQKGEKYEGQGELNAALERFQYAASILDQLAEKGPAWQPAIVKYRKERTSAAVARILRKMEHSQQGGAPKILPPSGAPARPVPPEKSDVFDFKSYLLEEKKVTDSVSAPLEDKSTTRDLEPANSRELLTLKLRYKEPAGDTSKLLEFPLTDSGVPWEQSSRDLRFAAAVAGYGMLLRDSPHKGQATWSEVAEWAQEGLGADASGYRAEFLTLIEKAKAVTPKARGRLRVLPVR